jgi:hypothetical protein
MDCGTEEDLTRLDAGYCYCYYYHTPNSANPQAQLLLGQPGRCLQVLRSYPRRVSLVSAFSIQFIASREVGEEMGGSRDGWVSLLVIGRPCYQVGG